MRRTFSLFGVLSLVLPFQHRPAFTSSVECIAQTSSAQIKGHVGAPGSVCEWLGIPYASPPTGQRRFAPPAKSTLEGSVYADHYGYDCPQTPSSAFAYPNATAQYQRVYAAFVNQLGNVQSEDCLTLNIWSSSRTTTVHSSSSSSRPDSLGPKKPKPKPKPVIVWIHGGRFSAGSSHTPFYDGGNLASAQDVVVVTFNFRMNIFGFPGSPATTTTTPHKNIGFLDQYLAVEWVHENIAAFGGDPERITIIGQSSGAVAVSNWAYAFKDRPIVAGTMSHSGNVFSFPFLDADVAASNWNHVASMLGCGGAGASDSAVLSCMRSENISFQAILNAVKTVPSVPGDSSARSVPPFQATVDNTTVFSIPEYLSRLKSRSFAHDIPHLQIHNDHESGFYRISALAQGRSLPESQWQDFELESFTCAAAAETYWRARAGVATYRVRYLADWDNLRLYDPPSSGAYHGVEVNMVTGNSESVSGIAPSSSEAELMGIMQEAWAAFAADPVRGLRRLGWPNYQAGRESLIRLGVDTTPVVDVVSSTMYDGRCRALNLSFWDSSIPT
ncbi:alpha/beta-hydrolase [Nemania sp. FL0916]|nr:alpha/beta-hydrolase [Nemania sp. FL0916]